MIQYAPNRTYEKQLTFRSTRKRRQLTTNPISKPSQTQVLEQRKKLKEEEPIFCGALLSMIIQYNIVFYHAHICYGVKNDHMIITLCVLSRTCIISATELKTPGYVLSLMASIKISPRSARSYV